MRRFSKTISEDYLKILFELQKTGEGIRAKDIAKKAGVSKGNVSQVLRKLAEKGLINYEPYREIELTEKGLELVKDIIEKHAVSEQFIEKSLGVKEAHAEAHILEHALSQEAFDKMKLALMKDTRVDSVNKFAENEELEIIFTKISDKGTLATLNAMGIMPGERIVVVKKRRTGPSIVRVKGREIAISRGIIRHVFAVKAA